MSLFLFGFITIIVLLIIVLIYLLLVNKNISNGPKKELSKANSNLVIADLNSISFPKNIEQMNADTLFKACTAIYDSYKSLDYINKLPSSLDKIEWHTWQISILLNFLKSKNKLIIRNSNDKIFHNIILNSNETSKDQDIQRILRKYLENVNITKNRDTLSKDIIWTARDVSIILYKIINTK